MAHFSVYDMTRDGDWFTINARGPRSVVPATAVELWKEDACQQAELAFPGDEEAVDRNQQEVYDIKADLLTTGVCQSEYFDSWYALVGEQDDSVAWLCYDIQWDVDEGVDHGPLPAAMVIHAGPEDGLEELSDMLSATSGMCHKGFKVQVIG